MPRTIEGIVECHRAARALIEKGRSPWTHKVDIRSILARDPVNEDPLHLMTISREIAAQLRAKLPARYFDITHEDYQRDLDEAVENMEDATDQTFKPCRDTPKPVEMLNGWIDEIYDWADANRVWLGS